MNKKSKTSASVPASRSIDDLNIEFSPVAKEMIVSLFTNASAMIMEGYFRDTASLGVVAKHLKQLSGYLELMMHCEYDGFREGMEAADDDAIFSERLREGYGDLWSHLIESANQFSSSIQFGKAS